VNVQTFCIVEPYFLVIVMIEIRDDLLKHGIPDILAIVDQDRGDEFRATGHIYILDCFFRQVEDGGVIETVGYDAPILG